MQWLSPPTGKRGRQPVFSDVAIPTCLTLKALFRLPLRQTTGVAASLLEMAVVLILCNFMEVHRYNDWDLSAQGVGCLPRKNSTGAAS